MKEEKMWDEKVVIRLYFFCFVWYLVIFSYICTVRNKGWVPVPLYLKQKTYEEITFITGYGMPSIVCICTGNGKAVLHL